MAGNPKPLGSLSGIGPADNVFDLTPHATNSMPANRAFSVNVDGNLTYRSLRGAADVVFTAAAGVIYPVAIDKLRITGTTATGILGYN